MLVEKPTTTDEVNENLQQELQERLSRAGVEVVEARLSHLAYAPEIAGAMLRRQQAEAIIAARKKIVNGAVSMVEMALKELSERSVVELDDERRAHLASLQEAQARRNAASKEIGKARAQGLSRFVILYPDHGYGRTMERLFDQEVAAAGGVYCEGVAYPPGTKSFVDYVRTVLETTCDVVLFADVADQVALIAPTFAAEGAWSVTGGALPEHAEREVHFLLPSLSWSSKLLGRAQRYLQGALVALPFYEASEAALSEHFRTAYETRYGRPPQTFAAYGYDA